MAARSTEREKGHFGGKASPLPVQQGTRGKSNEDQSNRLTNSCTQCRS